MNVLTAYNNFARGKIDHDMMGRFDLPVYNSGSDEFTNFISNFKGNAIFRAGFESMIAFQDCVFIEFKFSTTQSYLCVFYASKIRFLSYDTSGNFGWVLDGSSNILEVASPYTLAECRELGYSQNSDVMVVTHRTYAPRKLTRVSANSFTLGTYARTADPFTSANNYPHRCLFYKGRLYFGRTNTKPTTVWASVAGSYDDFTKTPVTESTALEFTLADIAQPIEWLYGGENSLIVGATDGICAVNGGSVGSAITAASIESTLTSATPCSAAFPIRKDGLMFYVDMTQRRLPYFSYDLLTESFQAKDANLTSYDITAGNIAKIKYKKDKNDLIFGLRNGDLLSLNFKQEENIVAWHEHDTSGDFKDLAVITDNNGIPQLFALVLRNGTYYIERQGSYVEFTTRSKFKTSDEEADITAYKRKVAEELKGCNFLDNSQIVSNRKAVSITYNAGAGTVTAASAAFSAGDVGKHIVYRTSTGYESGRFLITAYTSTTVVSVTVLQEPTATTYADWYLTFGSITGLSQYNGTTVSVVADGGYLTDFAVSGGSITLNQQVTHAVIGYKYKGQIKSFPLGFQIQAENTQVTMKAISQASVRCVATAGLKVGTTPYRLEPVQELQQDDLNYLPPTPIDGTKSVSYTDDHQKDKYFYIVQDEPLPATIACLILNAAHTIRAGASG